MESRSHQFLHALLRKYIYVTQSGRLIFVFFSELAYRYSSYLSTTTLGKILDLIVSALAAETDAAHADIQTDEQESIKQHKELLEILGFLLQWSIAAVEIKAAERPATTASTRGRLGAEKTSKSRTGTSNNGGNHKDGQWNSTSQILSALGVMSKAMKLNLGKVFLTTSERDTFVSLFTRPVYQILESEARTRNSSIRMHTFKVLCTAVKHHGHAFGKSMTINQALIVLGSLKC